MTMSKLELEMTDKFVVEKQRQPSAQEKMALLTNDEKYQYLHDQIDQLLKRVQTLEGK